MDSPSPRLILSRNKAVPVLFQAYNRIRLRYTAVALYDGFCPVQLATDSIETAVARGIKWIDMVKKKFPLVIVSGLDI